jgi:hypothetical protein
MAFAILIFPVFFIGMWTLVTFFISRMGWNDLAKNYQYDDVFTGTRIGMISASINSANYKNSLVLKYNKDGIYLRPVIMFRMFHKPILIPWKEIKEVRDRKVIFNTFSELIIGDPLVAVIRFRKGTFEKIKNNVANHNINWK